MKKLISFALLFALVWPARAAVSPATEIKNIVAQYEKAVDGADTELAGKIWSHGSDVSFIHPLGREEGIDNILTNVFKKLMGEVFTDRHLIVHNPQVHVLGNSAWMECTWDFTAKLKADGTPVKTAGRETQVYRKESSGWKIVHVHYSAMPEPAKPQEVGSGVR